MSQLWERRGAVPRREVVAHMGERALRAALAVGTLTQPWRGVVMRTADLDDLRIRAEAALLAARSPAVVSGPTALALHGCVAVGQTGPIHVTVPYSRSARSRPGLVMHQNRYAPDDVVDLDGLPVFALDLAVADHLCGRDRRRAFGCLDEVLRSHPDPESFRASVRRRLATRDDRRGVAKASQLTDLATGRADSPPESSLLLIVVEAGLPIPEAQHCVYTIDGRLLYVLDLAWESWRIALEYDGYDAHEHRADADAERDRRLAGRGWRVIRATAADLRDPTRMLTELREVFAARFR
ncbi:endonuclease domain-containing protein [Saccharomonospora sp. NB11]|jgi:hypothetical protein|uniref:endonuclease domain-containing protein n=1 Tax=Saccharomonospora sp. NB11 TaxID=1642298 RepID=UPI0018D12BC3|nr:DUF559 domain-containing protein [Saccharomonospora sp. NB11]